MRGGPVLGEYLEKGDKIEIFYRLIKKGESGDSIRLEGSSGPEMAQGKQAGLCRKGMGLRREERGPPKGGGTGNCGYTRPQEGKQRGGMTADLKRAKCPYKTWRFFILKNKKEKLKP